jgi:hypothetical protein
MTSAVSKPSRQNSSKGQKARILPLTCPRVLVTMHVDMIDHPALQKGRLLLRRMATVLEQKAFDCSKWRPSVPTFVSLSELASLRCDLNKSIRCTVYFSSIHRCWRRMCLILESLAQPPWINVLFRHRQSRVSRFRAPILKQSHHTSSQIARKACLIFYLYKAVHCDMAKTSFDRASCVLSHTKGASPDQTDLCVSPHISL